MLLDLELLRQILLFLPLDFGTNGTIIHEISRVVDFCLVEVRLLKDLILEIFVVLKGEGQLETGFLRGRKVGKLDVDEMLESTLISVGNELRDTNVIAQCSQPELWDWRSDRAGCTRIRFGQRGVFFIVLLLRLLALLYFFCRRRFCTENNIVTAFVKRVGQV